MVLSDLQPVKTHGFWKVRIGLLKGLQTGWWDSFDTYGGGRSRTSLCSAAPVHPCTMSEGLIRLLRNLTLRAPTLCCGVPIDCVDRSNQGSNPNPTHLKIKKGPSVKDPFLFGGERGIRTPGRFPVNGFQARQKGVDLKGLFS